MTTPWAISHMHSLGIVTSEWANVTMTWAAMTTRCPDITTHWAIFTHAQIRDRDKCMGKCDNVMGKNHNKMP